MVNEINDLRLSAKTNNFAVHFNLICEFNFSSINANNTFAILHISAKMGLHKNLFINGL